MKKVKILKDPIYGYINIPVSYMNGIVDTASFQRLRRIIQTTYTPLYASAVHNRFVHSIGVFHLGEIACTQLVKEIKKKAPNVMDVTSTKNVFLLACLLHDVGHAPFSHTGEKFYLDENREYDSLHEELKSIVNCEEFSADVPIEKSAAAAPHEIMSVIVGLKEYKKFFKDASEREFFARCITGYRYSKKSSETSLRNCFISLLNSKINDVDKLDYLLRDAFMTGFNTVNIDYERLLTSLALIHNETGFELGYYKSAISVLENVVYAHDSERKWIQNHPIVLYECYILQHIISNLSRKIKEKSGKKLFSIESLSKEGQHFDEYLNVRLLCDDDIVCLMKNVFPNELSEEYFERKNRRHPVWKSEAEYKAFFMEGFHQNEGMKHFEKAMEQAAKYLTKSTDSWVIDDRLIRKLEQEMEKLEQMELDEATKKVQREQKQDIIKVMKCLKDYADEKGVECSFVILMASQFSSGFSKPDFSATNILFKTVNGEKVAPFGDIGCSLNGKETERGNFFYLFYKRKDTQRKVIDNAEICKKLLKAFE